jgi:hypothetical protein
VRDHTLAEKIGVTVANTKRSPSGPEKYRGVEYSIAMQAEGLWEWKLHPTTERVGAVISGTTRALKKEPAVDAAYRAIDKMLERNR